MYSIVEVSGNETKKAKGINKSVTEKTLRHALYARALMDECTESSTMRQIRSFNHEVYTTEMVKVSLSPYDDKRYVLNDRVSTLAHGHYKIRETRQQQSQ